MPTAGQLPCTEIVWVRFPRCPLKKKRLKELHHSNFYFEQQKKLFEIFSSLIYAPIAQWSERDAYIVAVTGSSPVRSTYWTGSSVGRALDWSSRCRGFGSLSVHNLASWLNGYNATLSRCVVRVRIPLEPPNCNVAQRQSTPLISEMSGFRNSSLQLILSFRLMAGHQILILIVEVRILQGQLIWCM